MRSNLTYAITAILLTSIALARPPRQAPGPVHADWQRGEDGTAITGFSGPTRQITASSNAQRGGLDVAIIASASANVTDPFFTDPQSKLFASGFFSSVSIIHAGQMTPALLDLQAFDAVLIWSNFDFADADALGENLADYVNGGGGVVVAVFANSTSSNDRILGGRWQTHDYAVIPTLGGTQTGSATLGVVHNPVHPIMLGIGTFSGGSSSFRPTATAITIAATEVLADWSDGKTLIAVREDTVGARVDLGLYPVSDAVLPSYWDDATDGDLLLANALKYAAERVPLSPGDSDGDGDVDNDDSIAFQSCYTGPDAGPVTAGCAVFDFDADMDVDCCDWQSFETAWTEIGPPPVFATCSLTCLTAIDCDDTDACTFDTCVACLCEYVPEIYADIDHNGTVNLLDLFCVLNGFNDLFVDCTFEDVDLNPCGGNETINLLDLFAVLKAFSDDFECPHC